MNAPFFSEHPPNIMNILALADHYMSEIDKYGHGEPYHDQYGLELIYCALVQRDPLAWEAVKEGLNETMLRWMRSHPLREAACRLDSEENYVAQATTRFWHATTGNQNVEFQTLAAALQYLRASLNGAILDTLRTYSRSKEIPLSHPDEPGEPLMTNRDQGREVWENIRSLLPNEREQQLAYLLFHCGLGPREIVRLCPYAFSDVCEIYRLRRNIFERLLSNTNHLP
jgi:hypothetical protein